MKKRFHMAVGISGNRVMYTNIIHADSPEEAAKIYLQTEEPDKVDDKERLREIAGKTT